VPEGVKSQRAVTIAEVKAILEKIEEPSQFQLRTLDYANKFAKMDPSMSAELVDRLVERFEIDRLDAVQIVNCMPSSIEELRSFFAASRKKIIMSARLAELLKLLDEYRSSP